MNLSESTNFTLWYSTTINQSISLEKKYNYNNLTTYSKYKQVSLYEFISKCKIILVIFTLVNGSLSKQNQKWSACVFL